MGDSPPPSRPSRLARIQSVLDRPVEHHVPKHAADIPFPIELFDIHEEQSWVEEEIQLVQLKLAGVSDDSHGEVGEQAAIPNQLSASLSGMALAGAARRLALERPSPRKDARRDLSKSAKDVPTASTPCKRDGQAARLMKRKQGLKSMMSFGSLSDIFHRSDHDKPKSSSGSGNAEDIIREDERRREKAAKELERTRREEKDKEKEDREREEKEREEKEREERERRERERREKELRDKEREKKREDDRKKEKKKDGKKRHHHHHPQHAQQGLEDDAAQPRGRSATVNAIYSRETTRVAEPEKQRSGSFCVEGDSLMFEESSSSSSTLSVTNSITPLHTNQGTPLMQAGSGTVIGEAIMASRPLSASQPINNTHSPVAASSPIAASSPVAVVEVASVSAGVRKRNSSHKSKRRGDSTRRKKAAPKPPLSCMSMAYGGGFTMSSMSELEGLIDSPESDEEDEEDEEEPVDSARVLRFLYDLRSFTPYELSMLGERLAEEHQGMVADLIRATERVVPRKKDVNGPSTGETFDWNGRFQQALAQLKYLGSQASERERIYTFLSNLAQDFVSAAKTYGRIIITEAEAPIELKTIKPSSMGGLAGGSKYIVNNILFKFAFDVNGLYGSDEAAGKVAGHDLKGLINYFNCGISDLHFPLMALVDYMGFRLIAMSLLPINKGTIVYGTSDGGQTIHAQHAHFAAIMEKCGKRLNLKPHRVGFTEETSQLLYSAADIEGHVGIDNKLYLLDFSRTFPPERSDPARNTWLYRLLRPELVKKFPRPLCSDAYSGFVHIHADKDEHIEEVCAATDYLVNTVLQGFARDLLVADSHKKIDAATPITQFMHKQGINLRYLGELRQLVSTGSAMLRELILVEMVARSIKHYLRSLMRKKMKEVKLPLEHPCRSVVVESLNLVFGMSAESTAFWKTVLKEELTSRFQNSLKAEEAHPQFDLKKLMPPQSFCWLFKKITVFTALEFSPKAYQEFATNAGAFSFESPFDETDLEQISVSVRHMNIVALAQGYVLKQKARCRKEGNAQRLAKLAIEKFQEALLSNPTDKLALRELADAAHIANKEELATMYYKKAIETDAADASTMFKFAVFLEETQRHALADESFLRALELNPVDHHCLQRYGWFLEQQGEAELAEQLYVRASVCRGLETSLPTADDAEMGVLEKSSYL